MRVVFYYRLFPDNPGSEVGIPIEVDDNATLAEIKQTWAEAQPEKKLIHVDVFMSN